MRATVQSRHLAAALKSGVAATNSPMHALVHTRITARRGADSVDVETSDSEIHVCATIPAAIETPGQILIHEALLRSVASAPGDILLRADGKVSRGRSHFTLPVLTDPSVFPAGDRVTWTVVDQLDPVALRAAMLQVVYSGEDKDIRPFCRAVHIEPGRVWATDGYQLSRVALDDYDGPHVAVPVAQVRRVCDALVEGATIATGNCGGAGTTHLRVSAEGLVVTLNLVDTKPVDIEAAIPDVADDAPRATVDRAGLLACLRRFTPFGTWNDVKTGRHHQVIVTLDSDGLAVADRYEQSREWLGASDQDDGIVREARGKARVGLDPKRMIAALSAVDAADIVLAFGLGNPAKTVIYPVGVDSDRIAHVVCQFTL